MIDFLNVKECPRCGGPIEPGYGAAGGDGLGPYWRCTADLWPRCGWIGAKLSDEKDEDSSPSNPTVKPFHA